MRHLLAICTILLANPGIALDLSFPGAQITGTQIEDAASVRLPDQAWTPGTQTPGTEGAVKKTALQVPNNSMTTLQLLQPLRTQLQDQGYTQVFSCADAECGGFDFRFQLDLIGEPAMHVDLGNYRYLLMRQAGATPHMVALVASPGRGNGFVHITEVSDSIFPEPGSDTSVTIPATPDPTTAFIDRLISNSHAVLDGLEFGTGSSELGDGPFASLEELATWLSDNPSARVILVGHTDAVGSLDANTSLSRRRAGAVAERLINRFGTDRQQLQAAGAGFLAPIASNLTDDGRAANRRVEVVLLSLN